MDSSKIASEIANKVNKLDLAERGPHVSDEMVEEFLRKGGISVSKGTKALMSMDFSTISDLGSNRDEAFARIHHNSKRLTSFEISDKGVSAEATVEKLYFTLKDLVDGEDMPMQKRQYQAIATGILGTLDPISKVGMEYLIAGINTSNIDTVRGLMTTGSMNKNRTFSADSIMILKDKNLLPGVVGQRTEVFSPHARRISLDPHIGGC